MMESCLIPSDNAPPKKGHLSYDCGSTVLGILSKFALYLSCELFWNSSFTNVLKLELVLDDCMRRCATPSIPADSWHWRVQYTRILLYCMRTSDLIFHHQRIQRRFLKAVSHSCIFRYCKALLSYCAQHLWWIAAPGTPSAHKNRIIEPCSSFVHTERWATTITPTTTELAVWGRCTPSRSEIYIKSALQPPQHTIKIHHGNFMNHLSVIL